MAFSEFNRIVSSTYILQYIDDEKTRVQVQIALNRGEAFHKLKKAVFMQIMEELKVNQNMNKLFIRIHVW